MKTKHKLKHFLNCKAKSILVFLLLGFFLATPVLADLSDTTGLDAAAREGFGDTNLDDNEGIMTSIPEAIGRIIGALLAFVGVLFFILMIYGGITWMTARGNESEVTRAKDLIQSAVVGLVVVLAAYVITDFIASKLIN